MRQYDLIVFDWDGTLMDSAGAIVKAIQAAASDLALPIPSNERARFVIGLGLHDALAFAVPELVPERYSEMVNAYRRHYLLGDAHLSLFDGVQALLEDLLGANLLLAVATGKSRAGLNRAMTHTGLSSLFHATRCADECFSKPHPEMLLQILDELTVTSERCLMIGDTSHDIEMARNAGVDVVAVSFGAHDPDDLLKYSPKACVSSVEALRAWLWQHV